MKLLNIFICFISVRPGRLDRKVEFGLPDLEGRSHIFKIHARSMSVERDIRFELLARLCPNSTGVLFVLKLECLQFVLDVKLQLKKISSKLSIKSSKVMLNSHRHLVT
jgi:SpoVK/Ycf46/Vps4 family AAA+-type ATPase